MILIKFRSDFNNISMNENNILIRNKKYEEVPVSVQSHSKQK